MLECRRGQGIRLRDVPLCTAVDAIDKTRSPILQVRDIVFANVAPIEGIEPIVRTGAGGDSAAAQAGAD